MMRQSRFMLTGFAALVMAAGLYGCASSTPEQPVPSQSADSEQANQDADAHTDHHEGHGAMGEMKEGLAELSEEDRAAAEKQQVCPVSGEMLGGEGMGAPVKLSVKGQDVWICCEDCEEKVMADPDKYLAKLKK